MNDLGEKMGEMEAIPSNKSEKNKKYYPSESFNDEQLPGLSGKEVGDTITLTIKAVVKSVNMRDDGKGKKTDYRLEFHEGYCDESSSDNLSKEEKIKAMSSK